MDDTRSFADFMERVRAGDADASREFVRKFEGLIRREVRLRLEDPRLGRLLDSVDISQSVLRSFFVRASSGDFDLERPEQLVGLLIAMARHKLAFQARKQRTRRRGGRIVEGGDVVDLAVASRDPSPSDLISDRDLVDAFRRRLKPEEGLLAELWAQGSDWSEIAGRLGGTPPARRMQLVRAIRRVALEMKLVEADHG